MKRFKAKKKFNSPIFYLGFFFLSIAFTTKYLYDEGLIKEDTLMNILINDNFNTYHDDIKDVSFLLKYALNVDLDKDEIAFVEKETNSYLEEGSEPVIKEENPSVYIYSTHQDEKYQSDILEPYNISSGVFIASKILKEYLEDLGLNVIVEESSVKDALNALNLKYGSSYKITRSFMEEAKKKYPTLKYYIDLHRDSSVYDKTTTSIGNEKYARILFVVGLDNENYEPNLDLVTRLREKIDAYNSTLCRGIMKKSGKGVNGVYNQDFSEKAMLIEMGGQYNNISEVNNTLKVFAPILADFIKEDK